MGTMTNLLVTGGAGFIGSALVRWLLSEDGHAAREEFGLRSLVVLDALTYAGNPANLDPVRHDPLFRFVHGDITDAPLVAQVFREHAIDGVVHLAAESHVDRSIDDPSAFVRTNVEGTYCLLDAARRAWPRESRHRFLHVSTDEVFGSLRSEDPAFCETTPYAPNSPYAASKAASDHLARAYHRTYGLNVVISNCSNNYGPCQFPEKLIPLVILNALEGRPLPIYGDGGQTRDWLFVEDHARALVAALRHGEPGEVYTIGGGNEITNLQMVCMLCAGLDKRRPRSRGTYSDLITFVQDRPGHDRRYAIDTTKARSELGWAPLETLATGLERTIDWYLDNRAWCDAITQGTYRRERLGLS